MRTSGPAGLLVVAAALLLTACGPADPSIDPATDDDAPAASHTSDGMDAAHALDPSEYGLEVFDGFPEGILEVEDFSPDGAIATLVDRSRIAVTFASSACETPQIGDDDGAFSVMPDSSTARAVLEVTELGCAPRISTVEFDLPEPLDPQAVMRFEVIVTTPDLIPQELYRAAMGGTP